MYVNWDEINKALVPLKDYEDMSGRFQTAFSYAFVQEKFNFPMPELVGYTHRLLGGDSRNRYTAYLSILVQTMGELEKAGIKDILDLITRVQTRQQMEIFAEQCEIFAHDIVNVLKYLVYWCIPGEKYLSGLVRDDPTISAAIKALRELGVRTNLDILQRGMTSTGRKELADASGLPETTIYELVNRADFSRLPWSSKATISNIMGAGYCSIFELANADPEQLYADFFRYGKAIGKNLKLGNEIENSYRIAKIVPLIIQ